MFRHKTIIGRRLHARTLPNQRTEAKIGCDLLNRMSACRPPPASADTRAGMADTTSDRSMHQRDPLRDGNRHSTHPRGVAYMWERTLSGVGVGIQKFAL
jgi:hypothetical protein